MYSDLIRRATGETDPLQLAMIEDIMRGDNGGVLDHLDRVRFFSEARIAKEVLGLMREEMPDLYESIKTRVAWMVR